MTAKQAAYLKDKLFRGVDLLGGSKVSEALLKMEQAERCPSDSEWLNHYREHALQDLLRHAVNTTRFYSGNPQRTYRLEDFPVVGKELIRARQKDFLSDLYSANKLITMKTSGSTGTPFVCYQDRLKKKRVTAEVLHYCGKAGYAVGKSLVILKATGKAGSGEKMQRWLQNITVFNLEAVNDDAVKKLLDWLAGVSRDGSTLLAYASTYELLADYFKRKGSANNCNLVGMISISEMLDDQVRWQVEEAFGCRLYSRYSNQENGIIGQDDLENNVFIINEAHYLVEVLKLDQDLPVKDGEVGRIVVTDLFNYGMPLIRYDTGDAGALCRVDHGGVEKKAICNFSGRKIDLVYNSAGDLLSPHQVSVIMRSIKDIRQFQFIQEDSRKYLVRLVVSSSFTEEELLRKKLQALLGDEAEIKFDYPDSIPLAGSGKRNYIINQLTGSRLPKDEAN